jgi:hypothetical protein
MFHACRPKEKVVPEKQRYTQREYMCKMFREHRGDKIKVCTNYVQAERAGLVPRKSNVGRIKPEQYALGLWRDGVRRGWLR